MKVGIFRKGWIMLVSTKIIFIMCLRGIWYGYRGRHHVVSFRLYDSALLLLDLVRAKVDVSGQENIIIRQDRKYIIMCNHSSHYDIPLSLIAFRGANIRMIAKKELFSIPLFGAAMKATKTVCIDRKNLKQAIKDLAYAKQVMSQGFIIWVSPEGSRLRTSENKALKKGGFITAIQAKAMIIPMYINGAENILPAKTWDFYLEQKISVKILPQIDASEYAASSLPELMDKLSEVWDKAKE